MRDANRQSHHLCSLFEHHFEEIGSGTVTPATITLEDDFCGMGILVAAIVFPPIDNAITRKFTRIMTRSKRDIANILHDII